MPTSPTPADRPTDQLRAAAALLRAAATAAAEHSGTTTWQSIRHFPDSDFTTLTAGPGRPLHKGGGRGTPPYMHAPVSEYVALVGPGVGLAVAGWLESWAGIDLSEHGPMPEDAQHALAVARQLLGTTEGDGAGEPPLSPYYSHEACGFHWHGRDGMDIPMRDGQPVCPRCELAAAPPAPADRAATGMRGLLEHVGINLTGRDITVAGEVVDRAPLRDRIRRAVCEAEGFAWDTDMLEPDEYGEVADAVLAVLSTSEAKAHPAKTQWAVEIYDPRHSTWVTPTRFHAPEVAADAQAAYEKNTPTWTDGSPVQRRIVREETTYTVEPEPAAPAAPEEPQ
ncbi:hypothetical protein [Streptomyces cyaneofuscatus]|uniref:hypothetical protein n=1 Tax=Streptomyces cyaneofuscatus TaxID=66883 RepID=UPI0013DC0691|nr:hypothetical protein [Streptomyces cyaneofuscatus]NDZ63592.1 hypothetical protein [Streptomyces cyaneofuscatus]